jgi:hypothetical protein
LHVNRFKYSVLSIPSRKDKALRVLLKLRARAPLAVLSAVAVVATVCVALAPTPAAAAANVLVKGVGSGRCLAPAATSGAAAVIQDCAAQRWTTNDSGTITINGQCLDVFGEGTANGTAVTVWTCTGGANQRWTVNADGSIRSVPSGRCLDVRAHATAAGSPVQLWDCTGESHQKWQLVTDGGTTPPPGNETVGGGTIGSPAQGPGPSSAVYGSNFTLVKNWNFGADGTIRTIGQMSSEFVYHDHWNTIGNGTNYGAVTAAPDAATAISGQPVNASVRQFTGTSLKTTLAARNGETTVSPTAHNAVNGSFTAKFTLPAGGSRLNQDVLWETKVRYVTPRYHWFALWNAGQLWDGGAEFDVIESFGYDNGGGNTNYDGRYWHADPVGGTASTNYSCWSCGMESRGITTYDPTQYHTWALLYRKNNTYSFYVDGREVQSGAMNWTQGGGATGTPTDLAFLFDAGWGHTQVASVNHSMPASEFQGKFYEFDWSRVYLRN